MTQTLPVKFRKGEAANVTYDWQDYINNVGYKRFYGWSGRLNDASDIALVTKVIQADPTNTTTGGVTADHTFAITINKSFTVANGLAFATVPLHNVHSTNSYTARVNTISYYHVRGAVVTSIGSVTLMDTSASIAPKVIRPCSGRATLTETVFGVGDILRIVVNITSNNTNIHVFHDPASMLTGSTAIGGTTGTDMIFDIPIKLQY